MGNSLRSLWPKSGTGGPSAALRTPASTSAHTADRYAGFKLSLLYSRKRNAPVDSKKEEPSPKLIKLDTPEYLYQRLFVDGHSSDFVVAALGHEWKLHRVYLEQCEYFRSLFNGSWKDSEKNRVDLDGLDERITISGLNSVFASLYRNEVAFDLDDIGGILSTATLFNLGPCIAQCEELMLASIKDHNVVDYLELSELYGVSACKERCMQYLAHMFWRLLQSNEFLQKMSASLFELILVHKDLCVIEGERDIYDAIKRWIFIHEKKTVDFTNDELQAFVLAKPPGYFERYARLLQHIRIHHMITSEKTLCTLRTEGLFRKEIILAAIEDQWTRALLCEEREEMPENTPAVLFDRCCRRVGRPIEEDNCWRWSGYDFGLDLLFRCQYGVICMYRNHTKDITTQTLSMRQKLIVLDENGNATLDTKKQVAELCIGQKMFIGSYPLTRSKFSVHFFYLSAIPGQTANNYWQSVQVDDAGPNVQ
ncbi:BTB domain-containing protein [Aphelenchoides fujianensis]|nr:BTB domain-containing protein [Aphelenchoides fujianensis]